MHKSPKLALSRAEFNYTRRHPRIQASLDYSSSVLLANVLFDRQTFLFLADIDECDGSSPCSNDSFCVNVDGSYRCECNLGYIHNGTLCEGRYLAIILFYIVAPQLIKCMGWRLGENKILLIIYVRVGLCKNMGPISSRVYCIYFEQSLVMSSLANCSSYT